MNGNPFYVNPMGGRGSAVASRLGGLADQYKAEEAQKEAEARRAQQESKALEEQARLRKTLANAYRGDDAAIEELFTLDPDLGLKLEQRTIEKARLAGLEDEEAALNQTKKFMRRYFATPKEGRQEYLTQASQDPNFALVTVDDEILSEPPESREGLIKIEARGIMGEGFYNEFVSPETVKGPEATALQKEYAQAVDQGFAGTLLEFNQAKKAGPDSDQKTQLLQKQIEKIEMDIASKEKEEQKTQDITNKKQRSLINTIDGIIPEIDKALNLADESFTTGFAGAQLGRVPGTAAFDLRSTVDTVQANLGFDKLQQMRDQSPTGGALGQVTERELALLQSTLANINPDQSQDQLLGNLEKVKTHYQNWKNTVVVDSLVGKENDQLGRKITKEDINEAINNGYSIDEILKTLGGI